MIKTKTLAIKELFGDHAKDIAVNSTKSMTGHLLGAAGAIETIVMAMAIETGKVHPTINCDNPDEGLDLDYVREVLVIYMLQQLFPTPLALVVITVHFVFAVMKTNGGVTYRIRIL